MTEEQEDRTPVLVPVFDGAGPERTVLFVGNRVAAEDPGLLLDRGVTCTLSLAVNAELPPLWLPDGTAVRRTHIGLIDGAGNRPHHLLAAVLALHGILGQDSPGKSHYPAHRKGHVLVHCRGGRSRSVTVLALYLHLSHTERFATLDDALAHIRHVRGLPPGQPHPAMLTLAATVLSELPAHLLFGSR